MVDPVGFRFHPTDEEIVEHYVMPKNLDSNTSHVDEVMNTVDIYSFDPWELPRKSRIKSTDHVWYYFGCKKNQHNRGERQSRKTNSGFWKKTGVTLDIKQKRGNREKIGEKRVLVFLSTGSKSKSDWVMHEYVATFLPPTQTTMMTYTVCKVIFKGDPRDLSSSSSSSRGGDIEHDQDQSIIPHVNNSCGGLSTETEGSSFELHDPRQFSGFLHMEEEARLEDATRRVINNMSTDDWKSFLNNDDNGEDEQGKAMFMQEDRNDRNDDNGVFIGHSDDDSDSDSIS